MRKLMRRRRHAPPRDRAVPLAADLLLLAAFVGVAVAAVYVALNVP